MSNMSAEILRNLVSSIFNLKPTEVKLSGEISPNYNNYGEYHYCSNSQGDYSSLTKLFGFSPKEGFIKIEPKIRSYVVKGPSLYSNETHDISGTPLFEVKDVEKYIFFFEITEGDDEIFYKLFKAPDFKSHWAKIEQADLARWEQWLTE